MNKWNKWSTSYEPSRAELVTFGITCFSGLMAVSGIIFDQPVLGLLGVVILIVTILISLRTVAAD
jgi:hypothetical protein